MDPAHNYKRAFIGSAKLAESLAEAGLIDEYKLLVQPYIVGAGRHFFAQGMKTPVELAEVEELDPLKTHLPVGMFP